MSESQLIYEGNEVMARVGPGEIVDGVVKEINGDCFTVALFEGTTEMAVPKEDVWRNGYNFEAI